VKVRKPETLRKQNNLPEKAPCGFVETTRLVQVRSHHVKSRTSLIVTPTRPRTEDGSR